MAPSGAIFFKLDKIKTHQVIGGFFLVAGTGLEPVTFGL